MTRLPTNVLTVQGLGWRSHAIGTVKDMVSHTESEQQSGYRIIWQILAENARFRTEVSKQLRALDWLIRRESNGAASLSRLAEIPLQEFIDLATSVPEVTAPDSNSNGDPLAEAERRRTKALIAMEHARELIVAALEKAVQQVETLEQE